MNSYHINFTMILVRKCTSYYIYTSYLHVADEEFDELCFDFGIELDEVVSECLKHVLVCVFQVQSTLYARLIGVHHL